MQAINLETLTRQGLSVIEEVAGFIQGELGRVSDAAIETKSKNSLVSYVDKTAERRLVEGLGALVPASTFLTEEETVAKGEGYWQWVIDPLDGTTNFLNGIPVFGISVALRQNGRTVLVIVHEVCRAESFYAWEGGGAFLNGQPIRTSTVQALPQALLATGFPYYDYERMQSYLQVLAKLMQNTLGIRRLGSAAIDLAYVACGRFEAFFEYSLHPWDVAAGAFIVEQAGGRVADFHGGDRYLFGKEIIAACPGVFTELLDIVGPGFTP